MAAIYAERPNSYILTLVDEMRARMAADAIEQLSKQDQKAAAVAK